MALPGGYNGGYTGHSIGGTTQRNHGKGLPDAKSWASSHWGSSGSSSRNGGSIFGSGGTSYTVDPAKAETTSKVESANTESESLQDSTADTVTQEANTNDISSSPLETESDVSTDGFSWVTSLSSDSKDDSKESTVEEANTNTNTEYPNGMTKEEFNSMYEYALGMTGQGGNQVLDDYGEKTGFWGDFETIPLTIQDTQREIDDLKSQYKTLEDRGTLSETVANNIQSEIKEYESMINQSQEQLDALNTFIDKYKDVYSPIEKEEQKSEASEKLAIAEEEYEQAFQARSDARGQLTQALMKAGMDYNLTAEEILSSDTSKFELSKEAKNYTSKAAEDIVKSITARDFKGGDFALPVDTSAKEYGSYFIQTAPGKGIGVSAYNIRVVSPKGDVIATGVVTAPSAWTNGSWDIKDAKGNTIANGESTSAFAQSVTKALSSVAIADYENSKSTSSVPEDVRKAAQVVVDAEKNCADKEEKMNAARNEEVAATHITATETKQDIMDKYKRGELNPYQAAVALSNINDSMLDFDVDSITSKIDYNNFKDANKIPGDTGKGTVGISSLISDLSPVGRDNPASETNISKEITMEFKNLNELKETLSKVDTSEAKDLQSFDDLKNQVENINTQLDQLASSTFLDLAKDLLGKGVELANLDKHPEMQQLNNEIYAVAQMVLDKASELKEISGQYGLNDLTMKELKANKDAYSAQVALVTGKNGVTLLDKSNMRALVNYSKSLDATIDSAKALMTAAAVLHGAQDVQGGKYAEAWKQEAAEQKLTAKEWFATAATSTLSLFATIVGFGMMAANPLVGGALAFAGTKSLIEKTGKTVGKQTTATLTNYERMFGSDEKRAASVVSNVYDRGFNQANYGDVKSVGTYTTYAGSAIDAINAMAMLTNPVTALAGLGYLYKAGKSMTYDLAENSFEGKKNNLVTNVWRLTANIEEWADTNLGSQELKDLISAGETYEVAATGNSDDRYKARGTEASYGTTANEDEEDADKYYSGASEQAKNANLAKDYNAGMEQETNEAVSDKYVKVFKVMLDKEPDYIRKVLIAIPKNHSEREWK